MHFLSGSDIKALLLVYNTLVKDVYRFDVKHVHLQFSLVHVTVSDVKTLGACVQYT